MSTNTPPEEVMTQPSEGPKTAGVKPWRFESRPKNPIWVYKKGFISDRLITAWKDDRVEIGTYASPSYEELLNDWLCSDGSPCGHLPSSALASYYDNATQSGPIAHHEASKEKEEMGIPTVEELLRIYAEATKLSSIPLSDGIAAVREACMKSFTESFYCTQAEFHQMMSRAESAEAQLAHSPWISTSERMPTREDVDHTNQVFWVLAGGACTGPWDANYRERCSHWKRTNLPTADTQKEEKPQENDETLEIKAQTVTDEMYRAALVVLSRFLMENPHIHDLRIKRP